MALDISALNIGFSEQGLDDYKKQIKTEILKNTSDKINDVGALETAIKNGWQGESCDKFIEEFKVARTKIVEDIEAEYHDLENRFAELESNYYEQDKNMMGS